MDLKTAPIVILTGIVGFLVGIAADWLRQWSANWFSRRAIRKALQAEIGSLVVSLNFFILRAIEAIPNERVIEQQYFPEDYQLTSHAFGFYWKQQQERVLKLPEWSLLLSWYEILAGIKDGAHPPLFIAIRLFDALQAPPLNNCVGRTTATVIKDTLERADIQAFKLAYLFRKRGAVCESGSQS